MPLLFKQLLTIIYVLCSSIAFAQIYPSKLSMDLELKYRKGKVYKQEKYYKNGKLDSVFRQWNRKGQKLTEGYYMNNKKHGKWYEWLSSSQGHYYLVFTYAHGTLKKLYEHAGWKAKQDSIKDWEYFYTFEPDSLNYSQHFINWNHQRLGKKNEDSYIIVRNGLVMKRQKKVWENGILWKEEEERRTYDKSGKKPGLRKHGTWRLWNEDGTLQKETWYDMGQKLREKLYDHGKLTSDKKY